jgi:hypothetical protein
MADLPQESGSISLKELLQNFGHYWQYLKAGRKVILLCALIGSTLGLVYSVISVPTYTAEIVFVLENNKDKGSDFAAIASKVGLSMGATSGGLFQDDENIITFMKSRTMITKTLFSRSSVNGEHDYLIDRFVAFNNYKKRWGKVLTSMRFHDNPSYRTRLEDSVIGVFCKFIARDNLSVMKPDKKTDIIVASTSAADEIFAKEFTENLLENVKQFYTETRTRKSQENVNILQHQVDSIRNLLNSAISGVAVSYDANPNPNPAFQRLQVPSKRKMVDVEMNRAILEELVKNLELSKISLRRETPLIQAIDRPVLPLEKSQPGKIKSALIGGLTFTLIVLVLLSLKYYLGRVLYPLKVPGNSLTN